MNTKHIDFEKLKKVHFIGIGGISMSALARVLLSKGVAVSGSDRQKSGITASLEQAGADIVYEQTGKNITDDINLVVYTAAISADNDELKTARAMNVPTMVRADFLGLLMKEYDTAICVAGTHGKTTVTSMLAHILMEGDKDPTVMVGGILDSIGGNLRIGGSGNFLTEACEYTNSFLSFFPTTAVILNVAADHLDFFKDIDDIRASFRKFALLVPENGTLVINGEIPDIGYFTDGLKCRVITVGSDRGRDNISADNIEMDERACCSYNLIADGVNMGRIELNVTGIHNVYNSLAAAAAALDMGITAKTVAAGLRSYTGTERRFEYKGKFGGTTVIDDYAHHPDEIRATLETAAHYKHRELWVVFQPHTYSRTKALLGGFAEALSAADHVVLADIYAAREKNTLGISSADLMEELGKYGTDVHYIQDFGQIEKFLQKKCKPEDLLITMGAGNVVDIGNALVK